MALLKIWIRSFIPKNITGYTLAKPGGGGDTMIPGPTPISDCYLTDQRTFTNAYAASSRTFSSAEIDTAALSLASQNHHCDNTVECDCEDEAEECNETPDADELAVIGFAAVANKCTFDFKGGAGNPCAGPVAPDIDLLVHVIVEKSAAALTVKLAPGSVVEPFPAFEMYASLGGTTKEIFRRSPNAGATPWNLAGDPDEPVSGSVTFP